MKRINELFNKYLSLIVIGAAVIAVLIPSAFTWAAAITTLMLQFIMFFMGLTMKPGDFKEILKRPLQVFLVVFLQFAIMPLMGFVIARLFNLPAQMTLGLILVGSVPGGTSSNVVAYLANGDVPLSITATSISTLLAPIFTPLLLLGYAGELIELNFWSMFNSMISIVVIPIVLGVVVNYFLGERTEKIEPVLPTLSSIGIIIVLLGTVAVNAENILESGLIVFVVVTIHTISGFTLGWLGAKVFRLGSPQSRAVAVEVGMQNTGLSASLGLSYFSPMAALPGAVGAVVHNLIGVIYANICAYLDKRKAKNNPVEYSSETSYQHS